MSAESANRIAGWLFAAVSLQYGIAALTLAAQAPLWMDEILAVRVARLEAPGAVWRALLAGAEFSPPLYDWALGALHAAGARGPLALRLPSIVAVYIAALAIGGVAGRRGGRVAAALAAGVVLSSGLFGYAVQARPYGLLAAVFAGSLWIVDGGVRSRGRALALTLLLTIAVGLHFYAVLLVLLVALIELWSAFRAGRCAWAHVLAPCCVAALSLAAWWPILSAARRFAAADAAAPFYYARPTLAGLGHTYAVVAGWLLLPLAGVLVAILLRRLTPRPGPVPMTVALLALPLFVFVFALAVSHSFVDRYGVAAAFGLALLFADLTAARGRSGRTAALMILALLLPGNAWRSGGEIAKADRLDALRVVAAAPPGTPIVTGSGLRFLELRENLPATLSRRLVFVDVADTASSDPTNRNQVMRLAALDPTLPVMPAERVRCSPPLLLFVQPDGGGADSLAGWLAAQRSIAVPMDGGAWIVAIPARECQGRRGR